MEKAEMKMRGDKPEEIIMEDNKAVVVQNVAATPATLLSMAVQQGADLDKLEKLMQLQERWEANEAKKAFVVALSNFKADPPTIYKDKANKQYDSRYSSIGNIVNTTLPFLSKHGLSARWDVEQSDTIKVSCILTHVLGHSESTSMSAQPDDSGKKNPIQQIKSTVTYLKVTTFESILGLASTDANTDDDGNGAVEYITLDQETVINDLVKESGANLTQFLKYLKCESIDTIPASSYSLAVKALEVKKSAKKKAEAGE